MDKRTVIGLLFVGLIIVLYPYYVQLITGGKGITPSNKQEVVAPDSMALQEKAEKLPQKPLVEISLAPQVIPEKKVFVENSFYKGVLSTKGAILKSFTFKKYRYSQDGPIEIIPSDTISPLNITFPDLALNLCQLDFSVDKDTIFLSKAHPVDTLTFTFSDEKGFSAIKRFIFFEDKYDFQLQLNVISMDKNLGRSCILSWGSGVNPTEINQSEDLSYFEASSMMGTELVKLKNFQQPKGSDIGKMEESRSGETKWVATRSKYFLASLVPLYKPGIGFKAEGIREVKYIDNKKLEEKKIGVSLEMPATGDTFQDSFMVYIGPIDYHILKGYKVGLENLVDLGWKIIKPFSLAVLWIFVNLHKVIPNYGLVIIVFTILIKILFHPLTHKSVTSAVKMQDLQPKMAALKEKYKKDPQRMNQEIMKLYKDEKVNPFGGCLP
ncbi:MAG: membrane protein insertase YidC, partial [Candidatus Zixiibacteriota bacterium]